MRVCVASHGSPDYLIDIVADGMIRLLGRDKVALDYNVRRHGAYPHLLEGFATPDPFRPDDADVLVASTRTLPAVEGWMTRNPGKRVALVDGEDGAWIMNEAWPPRVHVYFKREVLAEGTYHPNVRPLPMAAVPEPMPKVEGPRKGVFCLVRATHPSRTPVTQILASLGQIQPRPNITKDEFNMRMASALVGVSARGVGWDTYRYWETAYFGAALVSQRLPIVIPGNFVEGEEALFFDGMEDLRSKVAGLLQDPEAAIRLGEAGRAACLARHLSVNRARTVLEALS